MRPIVIMEQTISSRPYNLRNYRCQLRVALESDHAAGAPHQD
jgi:hypothetical protein